MSYAQFIQQHIFEPLDMKHSYYMHNETIIPGRASGYAKTPQGYRQAEYINMMIPYAAGSLGSTVEDLILWDAALREGRLLDAASQERMYTPVQLTDGQIEEYGFGVRVTAYEGHRLIGHGGGIHGFHTFLARFIDDQMMIAVLANAPEINVERISRKIARHLFGLPAITHYPVALNSALLDKAVGIYMTKDGVPIDISRDGDGLMLQGIIKDSLLPINAMAYYASHDEEIEVHLDDEQDGVFNALTLRFPSYRTLTATRKQG